MITLRIGDSCYFETVRDGLVPCKFIARTPRTAPDNVQPDFVTLKVTRNGRTCYKAGELIETTPRHAIPRAAVRRRRYSTIILPYIVES